MSLNLSEITEGMSLPELNKIVTQESVIKYADASGDHNPIHLDPGFAAKMGLNGTVAHGMLVLAFVSSHMTTIFGEDWLTGGSINVKFKEPARPGDVLKITGKINKLVKQEHCSTIFCDVLCRNNRNETIITGEATVKLKEDYVI